MEIDVKAIESLSNKLAVSPERLVERALADFYFRQTLSTQLKLSLHKLYAENLVSREELLLFLTKDDAMDVILGDEIGKAGAEVAKRIWKATLGHCFIKLHRFSQG
jgi:hypothetical protein